MAPEKTVAKSCFSFLPPRRKVNQTRVVLTGVNSQTTGQRRAQELTEVTFDNRAKVIPRNLLNIEILLNSYRYTLQIVKDREDIDFEFSRVRIKNASILRVSDPSYARV
jgi:hypothetical protein